MAGESPGNSEQRKSSGVTTGEGRSDPRLGVFHAAPSQQDGEAAERNTEAVEEIAAAAELPQQADGGESAERSPESAAAESSTAEPGTAEPGAAEDGAADTETSTATGGGSGAGSGGADEGEDSGKPASDGGSAAEGPAAGEPDAGRTAAEEAVGEGAADVGSDEAPVTEEAETEEAETEEAETAAPDTGAAAEPVGASEPAESQKHEPAGSESRAEEPARDGTPEPVSPARTTDQPTAVFRAPKPAGTDGSAVDAGEESPAEPASDTPPTPSEPPAAPSESPEAPAAKEPVTTEPAAEEHGPEDGENPPAASAAKGAGAVDQPTTALRAADARTPSRADQGDAAEEEPEPVRSSRFVPLRSVDPEPVEAVRPDAPEQPGVPAQKSAADGGSGAASHGPGSPAAEEPAVPSASPAAPGTSPSGPGAPPAAAPIPEAERTRQQPLPPLALLAQLTNTPPPPETPLRTVIRRVKIWTPLVVLLLIVLSVAQVLRPLPDPTLNLTVADSYAFDGAAPSVPWPSEGQAVLQVDGLGSFGTFGEEKPVPIASVAKVMTAYVILRDHPVKKGSDGELITIDRQAADDAKKGADGESVVEISEGDKITQREAIEAIMIASANNIARQLARWDAGSEEAFVKKMNDTAEELGMKNTTYTDPSGLRQETVSTAADQVKLGRKAMDDWLFRQIVRQPSYTDSSGASHRNWNGLVPLDGVVGIKTGTTTRAGGNLLFAAEQEIAGTNQLIIGAVLGQNAPPIIDTVLAASKKLIDTAQDALQARKVVKKGEVVGEVDDGLGGTTPVVVTKDVTAVGWSGLSVDLALNADRDGIPHEAKAGTRVGTLTVGSGPGQVKVPVMLQEDLAKPGVGSKLTRVF
ncbi:serine hydrolase [Streptomyces sp. TP-A0874]|uniref:serine hydrolase n=1 Tax=Streptomyces sp. TP-A0874 TaxID=549819 RepID=UPI000853EDF4|nr:serine hydrolase [Streptomyces sp. TP-A0874]